MRNIKEFLGGMGIDPPKVVEKQIVEYQHSLVMPYLSIASAQYVILPQQVASSSLSKYTEAKALAWSVDFTDIDADADQWAPVFWYDTVDAAIWVLVMDTGTSPVTLTLGKVLWSTGGLTVIGSCQPSGFMTAAEYARAKTHVERANMGSGNLIVVYNGKKVEISTADGSLVSGPTMLTQDGINLNTMANVNYITEDGLLAVGGNAIFTDYESVMWLMRGGGIGGVVHKLCMINTALNALMIWGNCVTTIGEWAGSVSSNIITGPRFWDRPDFDRWLNDLADSICLPAA
jgi:hypothetical protein